MTAKTADRRREASQEIHSALDALLLRLKFEEVGRLAADLTQLADRPQIFLKVMSFARTMAGEQESGDPTAPTLRLAGGGHGALVDEEEGARRLDAVAVTASPETWAASELLGPEAMTEHLGVSRSTLDVDHEPDSGLLEQAGKLGHRPGGMADGEERGCHGQYLRRRSPDVCSIRSQSETRNG
jgi:hypothetical protein